MLGSGPQCARRIDYRAPNFVVATRLLSLTLGLAVVLTGCTKRSSVPRPALAPRALTISDVRPAAGLSIDVLARQDAAEEAQDAGDFVTCATLRAQNAARTRGTERAAILRGAARCSAGAGRLDDALRDVSDALEESAEVVTGIESDPALAALKSKPSWKAMVVRARARILRQYDEQLLAIFNADQADRNRDPKDIDFNVLNSRDENRRVTLNRIMATQSTWTPDDLYRAAMILQHAREPEAFLRAHFMCLQAVSMDPTHGDALRLAAASLDRFLMVKGEPQRFGTQIVNTDGTWRLFEVESTMSDDERAAWGVRPLARQRQLAAKMNARP